MALNIADLAEHAIDAVPDRVAFICGDDRITFAELEDKANRFAHYLIDHGVKKDDKVGLYCRNRIEIVIAMLGTIKAGAILVNVNFRYVEGELRYLFENSDMVALVHERQYADRVANVLPETPNVKTILVIEDGSDDDFQRYGGVEFYQAIAESSPERDFGERSEDDIYLLYTGGTTGFPKGVMWRHEDVYRVLFGGTDFATGEFIKDEYDLSRAAVANPPMVRYAIPPMIHGATQSATWMSIFSGQTTVLSPEFDADEVWRTIHDHKVNLLFFTGDAMARPLLDALQAAQEQRQRTRRRLRPVLAVPAGQHRRAVLHQPQGEAARTAAQPGDHRLDRLVGDRLRRHQHRRQGRAPQRRPPGHHRPSHRRARRGGQRGQARLRGARRDRQEGQHPGRLLQGREEDRRRPSAYTTACAMRSPATTPRSRRMARSRCWAAARCRSTAAARRSTPKKSRPRSRATRTCSMRWSSVCPIRASAAMSPPWWRRARAPRPTLAELDTFVRKEIAGYKVPRSLWLVDEVKRSPAGKPDYKWAKDQTELRPADEVHAKHAGAAS